MLGWEYVGNYKSVADPNDECATFFESACDIAVVSKKEISTKLFKSSKSKNGWGRAHLDTWRTRLSDALLADDAETAPEYLVQGRPPTKEERKEKVPSLAARARALQFDPDPQNMNDEALSKILVELNEYYVQRTIEFVNYDERIYQYCLSGKTNRNADGQLLGTKGGTPAKAVDYYNFNDTQV